MPNPWTGKGNPYTRKEVVQRLRATLKKGQPIIAAGAGTGSAAGPLALHLGRHGRAPLGATITVRQGVEMGRPSTIHARASMRDGAVERVEIAGSAVIVADGRLYV